MIAVDEYNLHRLFRYLEWVAMVFVAVSQLLWIMAAVKCDSMIISSFGLLLLSGIVSLWTPKTKKWWYIQLAVQIALICLASAFGARQYYYSILYVLAAKAALSLSGKQLIWFAVALTVVHIASSQYCLYAMHNIHAMIHPTPRYYRLLVVECEADLYFILGMITVTFLGRTLIDERASKTAERSLAVEVEALAVKLERARIARDIHDGLGHSLNSTKIQLERALKTLEENKSDGVLDLLKRCQDSSGASLREVRRAARTEHDDQFSLQKSVLELADEIKQESTLTFSVHLDEVMLPQKVQYQLFYIIQECLTNIRKHSGASQVEITLNLENGQAVLCVRDNGKGFDMNIKHSGFGRKGLFERTDSIGATLKVESVVGQGTAVYVRFPVTQK